VSGIETGDLVDGRYRVLSRLGTGGMADVFLVEDEQLGRKVALKTLHRRFAADPGFVERFRREAQAAASLQHPNVVSVYDRGAFDDSYYIAMEYLPGRSLKQLIREEAPLDPLRAIDIAIQILKAARFAHRRGVIHRDLKPHNVIVDDSDHAKVTDFGIARAGASDMTETGSIMGTAQYLSPEQAQGHAVGETSDLYSIGIVLYEMLTGQVPFDAESAVTIALKHVSEAPTPPSQINPAIPTALEQVVLWALNKNPQDRPEDADQFISVLEQVREAIAAGSPGQVTASMAAVGPVTAVTSPAFPAPVVAGMPTALVPAADVLPPAYDVPPPAGGNGVVDPAGRRYDDSPGRSPWPWLALLLVLLLLAGGGTAAYLLTRHAKATVPTVVNLSLAVAQADVSNQGFVPAVIPEVSIKPQGIVIAQHPLGGARENQGTTVTLTVSSGPGNVSVPPVVQLSQKAAIRQLRRAGLKVGRILSESSDTVPKGDATRTDPDAGTSLPVGSAVTLFVSSGKAAVNVPDVTGDTTQAAKSQLSAAGFKVFSSSQPSSSVQAGTVISQSPAGGSMAPPGTTINLVVAAAPTTAPVPGVVGDTQSAAVSNLRGAGFTVIRKVQLVGQQNQDGIVISQSPTAGANAKKGSNVTIVVGKFSKGSSTTPNLQPTTTTNPTTTTTTTTP
jgi:beta-lactam-binding protein with PASTA domain/predicted Ser/Thr protein kinase